jgi:hypothetical protein
VIVVERRPRAAVPRLGVVRPPGERLVTSGALMRHLPRKQGLGEMIGDDATESVQDLVAVFVG